MITTKIVKERVQYIQYSHHDYRYLNESAEFVNDKHKFDGTLSYNAEYGK